MNDTIITEAELTDLLGEVDPDVAERLIALGATPDDVAEAIARLEAEATHGPAEYEPRSARVAEVQAVLEQTLFDRDDPAVDYELTVPV